MPEEGSSASGMKDLTSTTFGYLIAFLLPGVFGLYALSLWVPQVSMILQPVLKADATVGPSAIFLALAVGMGLCVSAVRFFIFEKYLCRRHSLPANLFASLYKENKLTAFKAVVDEHYRYHQFYGGCAVGLIVLFSAWLVHLHWRPDRTLLYGGIGFGLAEWLLGRAAYDTFVKYVERGTTIFNTNPNPDSGPIPNSNAIQAPNPAQNLNPGPKLNPALKPNPLGETLRMTNGWHSEEKQDNQRRDKQQQPPTKGREEQIERHKDRMEEQHKSRKEEGHKEK
jgi:hypothetical protein